MPGSLPNSPAVCSGERPRTGKRFMLGEPMVNRTRDDGAFYWLHVLSKQGIPMNVPGWTTLLQKLTRATLEAVSYFSLRFGK